MHDRDEATGGEFDKVIACTHVFFGDDFYGDCCVGDGEFVKDLLDYGAGVPADVVESRNGGGNHVGVCGLGWVRS